MEHLKHPDRVLKYIISAPFIYWVFFAFLLLDVLVEIYHRICFPLYGIQIVNRKKYIRFDRHKLSYLSPVQKFNCVYCSYGNGLINYVKEIAAQTEKFWCGIRHEEVEWFIHPEHHEDFLDYGDSHAFYSKYKRNWTTKKEFDI